MKFTEITESNENETKEGEVNDIAIRKSALHASLLERSGRPEWHLLA